MLFLTQDTHCRDVVRFYQLFSQLDRETQRRVMEYTDRIHEPAQQIHQDDSSDNAQDPWTLFERACSTPSVVICKQMKEDFKI